LNHAADVDVCPYVQSELSPWLNNAVWKGMIQDEKVPVS
jgi:hypothetical protein